MMKILQEILPPPDRPACAPTYADWNAAQNRLGTRLPQELFEFSKTYGRGRIQGEEATAVSIFCPGYQGFVDFVKDESERYREAQGGAKNDDYPFDVFPGNGGLLPLGEDECGSWLCWVTGGNPDNWPIAVRWTWGLSGIQTFNIPLSEFMVGIITRKIELPCWPVPWFADSIRFEPYYGSL